MAEPKEHPLLMRPELVVATLAGRKTQTRRLVTPATSEAHDDAGKASREDWAWMDWANARPSADGPALIVTGEDTAACRRTVWKVLPRVRPGDRLWVREPWMPADHLVDAPGGRHPAQWIRYRADGAVLGRWHVDEDLHPDTCRARECPLPPRGWRPGIHLPRWASRLVLPVSSVRAERVTAISEDDARAEGVDTRGRARGDQVRHGVTAQAADHRAVFATLWDAINGDRAPWSADPWVWVYEWPPCGAEVPCSP